MGSPVETERRIEERRSAHGALLLGTFAMTRGPLSFDDLMRAAKDLGAGIVEVADWLAGARASGLVVEAGFDVAPDGSPIGPRLFVLADHARWLVRVDRRQGERRQAVAA